MSESFSLVFLFSGWRSPALLFNGEGEVRTRRGGARGVGGGSDSALFPTTSVPVWLSVALASCHTLVVDINS